MSVVEQLMFAVLGVTILALSLGLSDPRVSTALRGEASENQYTLQSCANR